MFQSLFCPGPDVKEQEEETKERAPCQGVPSIFTGAKGPLSDRLPEKDREERSANKSRNGRTCPGLEARGKEALQVNRL